MIDFDQNGLKIPTKAEVFQELCDKASVTLSPFLDGIPLKRDESSVIARILQVVAEPTQKNAEALQGFMAQFDLNQATGLQLDNFAWCLHRVKRRNLSQATGRVICYGDVGTLISKGSLIGNAYNGDTFLTREDLTLSERNAKGITISIEDVKDNYTITFSILGNFSASPNVYIRRHNEETQEELVERFVSSVNSQSTELIAVANNDNTLTIKLKDANKIADFGVSDGVRVTRTYNDVGVVSQTYKSQEASPNSLTRIRSSVVGWRSVSNPFTIAESQGIETDYDFKKRINLIVGSYVATWDAMYARLFAVKGVKFVNIRENYLSQSSSQITNNGVAITVLGGDDAEIAKTIFEVVPMGIATSGTVELPVVDIVGNQHIVKFSRPKVAKLKLKLSLSLEPDFPSNGKQLIKQALVDYFNNLRVGESVKISRLYSPINKIQGFGVNSLQIGFLNDDYLTTNLELSHDQVASLSAENIEIGGS